MPRRLPLRSIRRWPGRLRPVDAFPALWMPDVAQRVWGDRAKWPNSSLTAFAYLYRRFGPPPLATDLHKQLGGGWLLGISDREVYVCLAPGGCAINLYIWHFVTGGLYAESEAPREKWFAECWRRYQEAHPGTTREEYGLATLDGEQPWRAGMPRMPGCPPEIEARVVASVEHALRDLLRPVYIRDVSINIFGRVSSENPAAGRGVEPSRLAGEPVPVDEMERRRKAQEVDR